MIKEFQAKGIVERIAEHSISVKIVQQSACSTCHAKSVCISADQKEKHVEVTDYSGDYHVSEEVIVKAKRSLGLQAVLLAFALPLFLMLITLFITTLIWGDELQGALFALLILLPYYHILYLNRAKLKKKFFFTLSKINP